MLTLAPWQIVEKTRSQARLYRRKAALEQQTHLLKGCRDTAKADCEQVRTSNEQRRMDLGAARARLQHARDAQVYGGLQPVAQALLWNYSVQARRVSTLRRTLVSQLQKLFQLQENDEGRLIIVGILLSPERLHATRIRATAEDGMGMEELSTGLGYVVHFLCCVCKYLCVVPPYEMKFIGSTSWIRGLDGMQYELVVKSGNVAPAFRTALRLLDSNVCWLCRLAGIPRKGVDDRGRQKEEQLLDNLG